ncbi:hypothetical protein BHM03_00033125 [Ensete ventricosum]|nr:hypothetical protein BHM03_00033125 [Ensete ventricosum]
MPYRYRNNLGTPVRTGLDDVVRARREFAEGDRKLVGSTPKVHWKMIERLAESSEDQLTCQTRTIVIV